MRPTRYVLLSPGGAAQRPDPILGDPMASGRVHIRAAGGAIEPNRETDHQTGSPELLLTHAISVTDVDVLRDDQDPEPAVCMTVVVEDDFGAQTLQLLMPVDTARIAALTLALTADTTAART